MLENQSYQNEEFLLDVLFTADEVVERLKERKAPGAGSRTPFYPLTDLQEVPSPFDCILTVVTAAGHSCTCGSIHI